MGSKLNRERDYNDYKKHRISSKIFVASIIAIAVIILSLLISLITAITAAALTSP